MMTDDVTVNLTERDDYRIKNLSINSYPILNNRVVKTLNIYKTDILYNFEHHIWDLSVDTSILEDGNCKRLSAT